VWEALFWGLFSSSALYIGEALARPLATRPRATGLAMGFGAGTLLSAVAYELVPEASFEHGIGVGIGFFAGALAYYVGDRLVDEAGGAQRQDLDGAPPHGSGAAMFIGALLDGVPEAFILGVGLALGDAVSLAFVTAVFVSNVPQGIAGTVALREAGYSDQRIFRMWTALTIACGVVAALGFALADALGHQGLYAEAFAAGAVLTMLADSMMPEAFQHGGKTVGLVTVLGYLVAAVLAVAE
jgi:ZIP family zinc transporter